MGCARAHSYRQRNFGGPCEHSDHNQASQPTQPCAAAYTQVRHSSTHECRGEWTVLGTGLETEPDQCSGYCLAHPKHDLLMQVYHTQEPQDRPGAHQQSQRGFSTAAAAGELAICCWQRTPSHAAARQGQSVRSGLQQHHTWDLPHHPQQHLERACSSPENQQRPQPGPIIGQPRHAAAAAVSA